MDPREVVTFFYRFPTDKCHVVFSQPHKNDENIFIRKKISEIFGQDVFIFILFSSEWREKRNDKNL